MPPKPYDVSAPMLFGEADPDIDYFSAIQEFAAERIELLAKRVIHRLQRMPAAGVFEDTAKPLKSVCDEWCWYQANYDNDCGLLSVGFEETLSGMISVTVDEVSYAEAVLLSCAVCEDQEHMPARSDDEIGIVIRGLVSEAASRRSMARFEELY